METRERQSVLDQLASSESLLLGLVDALAPGQWCFRESPERWSIAKNLEHLILFEDSIVGAVTRAIEGPSEPEKKALAAAKAALVLGLADTRGTRFNARETVRPTGRWPDTTELIAEFRRARARTIAFATETKADLRNHFFPHIAFGDLDCYQWLQVLGQHTVRHALQIEQIKADADYPAL